MRWDVRRRARSKPRAALHIRRSGPCKHGALAACSAGPAPSPSKRARHSRLAVSTLIAEGRGHERASDSAARCPAIAAWAAGLPRRPHPLPVSRRLCHGLPCISCWGRAVASWRPPRLNGSAGPLRWGRIEFASPTGWPPARSTSASRDATGTCHVSLRERSFAWHSIGR